MRVQCRCGEVELELKASPIAQFYCHCDDCQAVHGAAYAPESVYSSDAVQVTRGEPKMWTLKRNPRATCANCGTRLFIEVSRLGVTGVNGYLLPAGAFKPAFHMQCQFAVRPIVDDLPHYRSRAPQFGGPDELIGW